MIIKTPLKHTTKCQGPTTDIESDKIDVLRERYADAPKAFIVSFADFTSYIKVEGEHWKRVHDEVL